MDQDERLWQATEAIRQLRRGIRELPAFPPSEEFCDRVLSRVARPERMAATMQAPPVRGEVPWTERNWKRVAGLCAIAASLTVAGSTLWIVRERGLASLPPGQAAEQQADSDPEANPPPEAASSRVAETGNLGAVEDSPTAMPAAELAAETMPPAYIVRLRSSEDEVAWNRILPQQLQRQKAGRRDADDRRTAEDESGTQVFIVRGTDEQFRTLVSHLESLSVPVESLLASTSERDREFESSLQDRIEPAMPGEPAMSEMAHESARKRNRSLPDAEFLKKRESAAGVGELDIQLLDRLPSTMAPSELAQAALSFSEAWSSEPGKWRLVLVVRVPD
jgi:hypothetical protein